MIEQLTPSLWRVGGGAWDGSAAAVTPDGANVYLIKLSETAVLIDCGYVKYKTQIEANIRETGVRPESLSDLILTHSHWDHSEAASAWREDYGLRLHANALGAERLRCGDLRLTGAPRQGPDFAFPTYAVDDPVADGQEVEIGGTKFIARWLPGHTPDSTLITAEIDGKRVGFCGDITFSRNAAGKLGTVGWLCMLWQSSLRQYKDSLEQMSRMTFDLLLPGHGNPVVGAEGAQQAVAASLATIEHLLADPWISSFGTVAD